MDNDSKGKLGIGSWSVHGFVTDKIKRMEIVEQVSKRDLDIVRVQAVWEEEEGNGMQSWTVRMDGGKAEGTEKNRVGEWGKQDTLSRNTFAT